MSSLALKAHPAPIVYVYQFTIRPGKVKGWHIHHLHDDRIFISQGTVKVVLYDNRPLMVIPAYVFHAHHNVGQTEALFISMPTRIYNHESPDVYRLPLDNNTIPYRFEQRMGW
ncbi:MAG: hypothetical protein DME75_05715 [Verrucomicrobia bacterium]|nr:MAG: hypothetical protein DME75_05715 [Verrucomicrobiota bacterium]